MATLRGAGWFAAGVLYVLLLAGFVVVATFIDPFAARFAALIGICVAAPPVFQLMKDLQRGFRLRRARNTATSVGIIASATEGSLVRMRGRVSILSPTLSESGEPCAACKFNRRRAAQRVDSRHGGTRLFDCEDVSITRGGVFAVRASTDVLVVVRAQHLLLPADEIVRSGDEVTVVGILQRPARAERDVVVIRGGPTAAVLGGTQLDPIVLISHRSLLNGWEMIDDG